MNDGSRERRRLLQQHLQNKPASRNHVSVLVLRITSNDSPSIRTEAEHGFLTSHAKGRSITVLPRGSIWCSEKSGRIQRAKVSRGTSVQLQSISLTDPAILVYPDTRAYRELVHLILQMQRNRDVERTSKKTLQLHPIRVSHFSNASGPLNRV